MLIPHEFVADGHYYKPKGLLEWCFATSDVIELNGMSDFNQVPPKNLAHAALRGNFTHAMIEGAKMGQNRSVRVSDREDGCLASKEASERLEAWYRFRKQHPMRPIAMERAMVYRHAGTEALIGVTPDLYGFVSCECEALYCPLRGLDNALSVIDIKTCHKQYGEKMKQLRLKWWAQTQSQSEALEADEELWGEIHRPTCIEKIVLHLHPDCGKIRGSEPTGFEVHRFGDGQFLWDSMIRVAKEKLAHGYKITRPKIEDGDLVIGNKAYEAPEDVIF